MRGGHGWSSGEAGQLVMILAGILVGLGGAGYASFRGMKWMLPGMPWPFATVYALGNAFLLTMCSPVLHNPKRIVIYAAVWLAWFGLFALPYWYHY
jgi:hypothetical protein